MPELPGAARRSRTCGGCRWGRTSAGTSGTGLPGASGGDRVAPWPGDTGRNVPKPCGWRFSYVLLRSVQGRNGSSVPTVCPLQLTFLLVALPSDGEFSLLGVVRGVDLGFIRAEDGPRRVSGGTSLHTPHHLARSPRIPGSVFAAWVRGEGAAGRGPSQTLCGDKTPFCLRPHSPGLSSECGGGEDLDDMVISCLSTGSFAPARAAVGQRVASAGRYNK